MDSPTETITYIVVTSTLVVLLMLVVVVDVILLMRKSKREHLQRVDDLMRMQEIESVNNLLKGQNEERRRIAKDLHDRLGSMLFTVRLNYQKVEKKLLEIQEENDKMVTNLEEMLEEAHQEVRRISHDLYEGSLARFGFAKAFEQLKEAVESSNEIKIEFKDGNIERFPNEQIEQTLYRIAQELLSNTLKHAKATVVNLELVETKSEIEMIYSDNGQGFRTEKSTAGLGMTSIKERADKINAELRLISAPGNGMNCSVIVNKES